MKQFEAAPAQSSPRHYRELTHEIRNGLTVISGHCQLIADFADLDPQVTERIDAVLEVCVASQGS